jgi:hypothetical protein
VRKLTVDVRPGSYVVTRLSADAPTPVGLLERPGFVSFTRTPDELSIVCAAEAAPSGQRVESGWRLLTVRGPFEFTLTGIMASLAGSLAAAGVPLFALSTFDTDHVLVKDVDLDRAVKAIRESGHEVIT